MTRADRLLSRVQERLQRYYALERAPSVRDFVVWTEDGRETTFVRRTADGVDLAVALPRGLCGGAQASRDDLLQLVEGVSHFLFLAERARTDLPTTQLELELQAEVDKFVVWAMPGHRLSPGRARRVHDALYRHVRYLHPLGTELGDRYRLANDLAARITRRVIERDDPSHTRGLLRRFYRAGQAEKIRVATAAVG